MYVLPYNSVFLKQKACPLPAGIVCANCAVIVFVIIVQK